MTEVNRKNQFIIGTVAFVLLAVVAVSIFLMLRIAGHQSGEVAVSAYVILDGASVSEVQKHKQIFRSLASIGDNAFESERMENFHILGHRVSDGESTVVSFRKSISLSGPSTDQNYFEKLTIMLPKKTFSRSAPGKIELDGRNDILVFWSEGNGSLPFVRGCYGYADGGQIVYEWGGATEVFISLYLSINRVDSAASLAGCKTFTYRAQWLFRVKSVSDLTPWEGGYSGPDIYLENFPE